MKDDLESTIGRILLQTPLVRAGTIDRLDTEELARDVQRGHAVYRVEDIKITIDSLLQQIPRIKTPEQRIQFYRQVNQLYQHAQNNNQQALIEFVDEQFLPVKKLHYLVNFCAIPVKYFAHFDGVAKNFENILLGEE